MNIDDLIEMMDVEGNISLELLSETPNIKHSVSIVGNEEAEVKIKHSFEFDD